MKTTKFKLSIVFFAILWVFAILTNTFFPTVFAQDNDLSFLNETAQTQTYAKGMVVIEAESGRILAQNNCNLSLPMASTTKIMTALVALKSGMPLDEEFEVDPASVGIEGTSLYLKKGERKTLRELLLGLMLPSGNDAAVAIACHVAGSQEKFVELMNKQAKDLGLVNTCFANAHGLDAENHHTSAYDLAIITAEAMKNETFCEIAKTKNATVCGNEEIAKKQLRNKNKLLWEMEECDGVKTGYTDNARRCFVASATKNGMRLVCVVLNCGPMFEEAKRLLNDAFEKYQMCQLLKPYCPQKDVRVENGTKDFVKTYSVKSFSLPLTAEERQQIKLEVDLPKSIEACVVKEQEIGEVRVMLDNKVLFSEKIYAQEDVASTKFFDKIEEIVDYWNL